MSTETREALGRRIRELREREHLSQSRFALMIGVERSYLAKVELGQRNPSFEFLEKIAAGFGLTVSQLVAGIEGDVGRPSALTTPSAGNKPTRISYHLTETDT